MDPENRTGRSLTCTPFSSRKNGLVNRSSQLMRSGGRNTVAQRVDGWMNWPPKRNASPYVLFVRENLTPAKWAIGGRRNSPTVPQSVMGVLDDRRFGNGLVEPITDFLMEDLAIGSLTYRAPDIVFMGQGGGHYPIIPFAPGKPSSITCPCPWGCI